MKTGMSLLRVVIRIFVVIAGCACVIGVTYYAKKTATGVKERKVVSVTEDTTAEVQSTVTSDDVKAEAEVTEITEDLWPDDAALSYFIPANTSEYGLEVQWDGTFTGHYAGWGYEENTREYCEWKGKFTDIEKVNDTSYKMTASDIEIVSSENGAGSLFRDGDACILYLPDTPVDDLPADFYNWADYWFDGNTIGCYAVFDTERGIAFVSDGAMTEDISYSLYDDMGD